MENVPYKVRCAVEHWAATGHGRQHAVGWPADRWIMRFPQHAATFKALPPRISRADVFGVVEGQPITPAGSLAAFLVSMAWGYGSVAYGPWRVARILETAKGRAGAKLARASTVLKELGPESAYEVLATDCRLAYLGPAFGTKFLFFRDGPSPRALIMDRLICEWLTKNTGLPLTATRWSPRAYRHYLALMCEWSQRLGVKPWTLEEILFSEQARLAGNQWA